MVRLHRKRVRIPRAVVAEAWFFVVAAAGALYLFKTGIVTELIMRVAASEPLLAGAIVGTTYSTFVTTPFAVASLAAMGSTLAIPIWQIAVVGAVGATVSDVVLAKFLRSPLSLYIVSRVLGSRGASFKERLKKVPVVRWCVVALGSFLVAIPVPTDELGIALFDASGLRFIHMLPLFFVANFIAIYAILSFVHAIA